MQFFSFQYWSISILLIMFCISLQNRPSMVIFCFIISKMYRKNRDFGDIGDRSLVKPTVSYVCNYLCNLHLFVSVREGGGREGTSWGGQKVDVEITNVEFMNKTCLFSSLSNCLFLVTSIADRLKKKMLNIMFEQQKIS